MKIQHHSSVSEIPHELWDSLTEADFPFLDHAFLRALELGGCVGHGTGWSPRHLTVWKGGKLVGSCSLYLKSHSYGEYIFDWEWAHAFERYHLDYYPKMVSAVPFTPATGRKLLVHPEACREKVEKALLKKAFEITREAGASSLHFLFSRREENRAFEEAGCRIRNTFQYHWRNPGYRDFEDFLSRLKRKRRKDILRERREVEKQGVTIETLENDAIEPLHVELMYRFYLSTIDKKWGSAYLSRDFFSAILERMRPYLVLILARQNSQWVAGSINYRKGKGLFGRYWGCVREFRFLHFELCYYRTIDYAIRYGYRFFEAGAQGSHKVQRGFLPEVTYSAHWIQHPGFRKAIFDILDQEKQALKMGLEEFERSPYRVSV